MAISFIVVNMVDIKIATIVALMSAAYLTGVIVSPPNLFLDLVCELVVVYGTGAIRKPSGYTGAPYRAVHTLIHIGLNKRFGAFVLLATLFTGKSCHLLSPTLVIAILRAVLTASICHIGWFVKKLIAAIIAGVGNLFITPPCVTSARAKNIVEFFGVVWGAFDNLAAVGARLNLFGVSAISRAKSRFALLDLVRSCPKGLSARLASLLDCLAVTLPGAKLFVGGGKQKLFTATWTYTSSHNSSARVVSANY